MSFYKETAKRLTLLALATSLTCGIALADETGPQSLDINGDQVLSKDEFLAGATARFDAADIDRDNFLSADERAAQKQNRRKNRQDKRFTKADLNNDGVISKEEFIKVQNLRVERQKQARSKIKDLIDINKDGQIDAQERAAIKDKRKADKAARRAERGAIKKKKRAALDANQDGFISRDEHMAAAERMFTFLDADQDGVLSQGEGKKRRKRRKSRKRRG